MSALGADGVRLEGWPHAWCLLPSFETLGLAASLLRMRSVCAVMPVMQESG